MTRKATQNLDLKRALRTAIQAARQVGTLLRRQLGSAKRAQAVTQYDIKLELDVRCQKLIERNLHAAFPDIALLGEEGIAGDPNARLRWVVDPIDGTVNYAYGIPHACVSIALQRQTQNRREPSGMIYPDGYQTQVGVVYDPFCDELWTAMAGQPARLNGRIIRVSRRSRINEAIVCIGLSKSRENLAATLPYLNQLACRVRKIRIMGSGALDLTYVATGRFDAYLERAIRLWDIAAGGLILQCAGGDFCCEPLEGEYFFRMLASNGLLRRHLKVPNRD